MFSLFYYTVGLCIVNNMLCLLSAFVPIWFSNIFIYTSDKASASHLTDTHCFYTGVQILSACPSCKEKLGFIWTQWDSEVLSFAAECGTTDRHPPRLRLVLHRFDLTNANCWMWSLFHNSDLIIEIFCVPQIPFTGVFYPSIQLG